MTNDGVTDETEAVAADSLEARVNALRSRSASGRDALARQLADLVSVPKEEDVSALTALVQALSARVEAIDAELHRVTRKRVYPVALADGRRFHLEAHDFLAVSMAAIVASRTGNALDVPLSDGSVAEKLRLGEIAEIARQLMSTPEIEQ